MLTLKKSPFLSEFWDTLKLLAAFFLWLLHDLFHALKTPFKWLKNLSRRFSQNPD